jgi:3-mercaptopyruvate sulfurtransferase SseA
MYKLKTFIVISLLLFSALACNALAPAPQSSPTKYVIVEPTSPLTESNLPLTEAEVPRVTLEDALVAYNSGAAVFVDVRSQQAYDASHIPGATNIQLGEFETDVTELKLPKDQWIITYCT